MMMKLNYKIDERHLDLLFNMYSHQSSLLGIKKLSFNEFVIQYGLQKLEN